MNKDLLKIKIPNDLSSGVYAAKLVDGKDEDYIPFFVKPKKNKKNKILFLAPTFSYMAYANEHLLDNKKENTNLEQSTLLNSLYEVGKEINYPIQKQDKYLIIPVTADRGLCGGFNSSINRETTKYIRNLDNEGKKTSLITIGKKSRDFFNRIMKDKVIDSYFDLGSSGAGFDIALEISNKIH